MSELKTYIAAVLDARHRTVVPIAEDEAGGLAVREYFAAAALQGLLAGADHQYANSQAKIAKEAVEYADALAAELAK